MAKTKAEGAKKVSHPHIHARLAFLQRAAQILEEQQHVSTDPQPELEKSFSKDIDDSRVWAPRSNAFARELSSHTTAVVRKTKIRISPELKRTICKGCSSKLIDGHSSFSKMENKSRDGKKPWAAVLVVTCKSCGMEKRFPQEQTRGTKKAARKETVP